MTGVGLDSIMKKVAAYGETDRGKARMRQVLQRYRAEGVRRTGAGGVIVTRTDLQEAASRMIGLLRREAQTHALPASVMRHFDSLRSSGIEERPDGSSVIRIYFEDSLHRDSLFADRYDGVENIVALLNNGYHANGSVYGSWAGHPPAGKALSDRRSAENAAYIRSRTDREGLWFIQQAIQEFNDCYGRVYHATAVAGSDYG